MYIKAPCPGGYDRSGEQFTGRGLFLILVKRKSYWDASGKFIMPPEMRAIVRKVALRQCGHFMMGSARVQGHRIPISGAYGGDGLPCEVPDAVFDEAVPVPAEIVEEWNHGGGHNSTGTEADSMRKWALANLSALYRVKGAK